MAPKKDKGKEETPKTGGGGGGGFTEVEKTFLELQVTECNRKIARLRSAVDEYELRNEELQKAYDKLDEDRADIIAYLKKTLNLKNEENNELKDKVKGLEETREIETAQFKETVNELERNFTIMKDQLTSENKLLAGKLNTLEEFRAIRDDLMRKFEKQEQAFKDQEMKYKRVIYDAEKKFVIGKDKLKKEMEARLLQLAQDFQDATELRIAASTHRVIRENIAINNELDNILFTQAKLAEQNEKNKESERAARIAMELAEEERDKAINKNVVQLKVIDQLTTAFQEIKKEKAQFEKRNFDFDSLQAKIQKLTKENENLCLQVRILEQNLHAKMSEQNKSAVEISKAAREGGKLKKILKEAAFAIQAALKLDQWARTDPTREIMDRQVLLSRLLDIITQYRDIEKAESMETLASMTKVYEEGDLGFIPKPVAKKSAVSAALSVISRESTKVDRGSISPATISSSTLGSIKTIPSVKLVPPSSEPQLPPKESVQSFVTSTKSSESESDEEADETEGMTDIEKQLAASKLEIQKSIMKDLAYSQMALQSQNRFSEEQKKRSSKSVVILETIEGEGGEEAKEGESKEKTEGETTEGEASAVEDEEKKDESEAKSESEGKPEETEDKPGAEETKAE
ncbi:cilia- and flagella-associated protein 157 [Manduca sexta]|uniref:cilia- and flagella-associated protein 157 n=1 Tax=Manduca sexta TaxID=7130 RepID=UPI00188E6184|nr:cilia- and flagella-associated protein 157 [Manduca sexta]